jgi:curved DNA-binding protein CbpA
VPPTYYEILGVPEHATSEEIEAAFKSKASEVHPDRFSPANPYLKNIAAEAFKNLSEAKAVLLDAGKRQKYDADLALSRGSSASPSTGGVPANAYRKSASAAPAAASTPRVPRPFLWLVNAPSGLFALGIVFAAILLAGGIALYRARSTQAPAPTPAQTTPAANPPENQSSQAKRESHGTVSAYPNGGQTDLPAPGPKTSKSRRIVLWRASEPPDLAALNPAERQAIEEACSYAKLMESPQAYNGCLAKELAVRDYTRSDQH